MGGPILRFPLTSALRFIPVATLLALGACGDGGSLAASGGPSVRYLPGVAYDEHRGVLVVSGGGDPSSTTLFADTWEFDGNAWSRRQ